VARTKPTYVQSTKRKGRIGAAWGVLKQARQPGSPGIGARIGAIPRMIGATLTGRYPGMSRARLLLLAAGTGYIVSPIDAMPEMFMLFLGVADDIGVAVWLAGALLVETDHFLAWERGGAPTPGEPQRVRSERLPG
jgi:hypothetical protein